MVWRPAVLANFSTCITAKEFQTSTSVLNLKMALCLHWTVITCRRTFVSIFTGLFVFCRAGASRRVRGMAKKLVGFIALTTTKTKGWRGRKLRTQEGVCLEKGFIHTYTEIWSTTSSLWTFESRWRRLCTIVQMLRGLPPAEKTFFFFFFVIVLISRKETVRGKKELRRAVEFMLNVCFFSPIFVSCL